MSAETQRGKARSIAVKTDTSGRRSPLRGIDREIARRIHAEIAGTWEQMERADISIERYGGNLNVWIKEDEVVADLWSAEKALPDGYEVDDMMAYSNGNVKYTIVRE